MFIEVNTDLGVTLININNIACIVRYFIYFIGDVDAIHVKETYEEIKSKIKATGGVIK